MGQNLQLIHEKNEFWILNQAFLGIPGEKNDDPMDFPWFFHRIFLLKMGKSHGSHGRIPSVMERGEGLRRRAPPPRTGTRDPSPTPVIHKPIS